MPPPGSFCRFHESIFSGSFFSLPRQVKRMICLFLPAPALRIPDRGEPGHIFKVICRVPSGSIPA